MKWRPLILAALVLLSASPYAEPVHADESEDGSFIDRVNKAIEQGVDWLLAKPSFFNAGKVEMAHWGLVGSDRLYGGGQGKGYSFPAGPTALAVYTLLKCEVDPKHPVVERGFNWLREVHPITEKWDGATFQGSWRHTDACSSYELSMMILALTAKYDPDKENAKSMERARKGKLRIKNAADRKWLFEMLEALVERRSFPSGRERKGWRYNGPPIQIGNRRRPASGEPPGGAEDLSSTQLATLAIFSASRFGARAEPVVWHDIADFTLAQQATSGKERRRFDPENAPVDQARGFSYIRNSEDKHEARPTSSMTACGVANLLMVRDVLARHKKTKQSFPGSARAKEIDTAIDDGLAWLDLNWSPFKNRFGGGYHIYYLYALERAMDLRNKKLVGKHLWYREGAEEILKRQNPVSVEITERKGKRKAEGVYWNAGGSHRPEDVLDTCFALLFLKRATKGLVPSPVVTGGD